MQDFSSKLWGAEGVEGAVALITVAASLVGSPRLRDPTKNCMSMTEAERRWARGSSNIVLMLLVFGANDSV